VPIALSPEFIADATKQAQLSLFLGRTGLSPDTRLESVVEVLQRFLLCVAAGRADGTAFTLNWPQGGDWQVA